jgi:nickel superoxide dismutase
MKKIGLLIGACALLCTTGQLSAHCQMPCGIYHDEMVFGEIDQYVETMYKGMTVLTDSKFETVKDRNEFVRWVITKDKLSDKTAELFNTYFLQQKIKPDEPDTPKKLIAAHKLLFLMVQIKQNADIKLVDTFADEWDKFKTMFHVEGYACKVEMLKIRKRQQELLKEKQSDTQEHDHNHDHDHEH